MSISVIAILRVIHIGFGAFWLGGAITVGFFLLPAMRARGAAGSLFAAQLMARTRLPAVMTAAGVIAVLAGMMLYGAIWAGTGFSGPAFWYAMGGHFATAAVLLVGVVAWPAAHKLGALAHQESLPTPAENAQRDRLLNRVTWVTQLSAALLVVTVSFMAIGRYV